MGSLDGQVYAGPFLPASLGRRTMTLTHRLFGIRSCNEVITGQRGRPCLEYDIHRCLAPCVEALCSPDQYAEAVNDARLLLEESSAVEPPLPPARRSTALLWPAIAAALFLGLAASSYQWWRATQPVERPLARLNVDLGPAALPAVAGGSLYLRGQNTLFCIRDQKVAAR